MPNPTQLRLAARKIFDEALRAADARDAVQRALRLEGSILSVCDTTIDLSEQRPIYAIAIGKAAFAMASALDETLGKKLAAAIITTSAAEYGTTGGRKLVDARRDAGEPQSRPIGTALLGWQIFQGGHPEPNEESLSAARACVDLLQRASDERAIVIFLISGGGSAMIEWPISQEITLAELRSANEVLIKSGASILEINTVRRSFSAVKGGRLAAQAPNCVQVTLIVSDVPSGNERNVASGPSLAPPANAPEARTVIDQYHLRSRLPENILRAIDAHSADSISPDNEPSIREYFVLLDNESALNAAAEAARALGFVVETADDIADQPIADGCAQLIIKMNEGHQRSHNSGASDFAKAACLISGGEFACPVRGNGIGGRNLESALRLAIEYEHRKVAFASADFVALCAGTDGIDGNSPAAGAIVDNTTIERARAIGLDPEDFLDRSDAYSFFVALGDVIATGPTGTNVRDIRILLAEVQEPGASR